MLQRVSAVLLCFKLLERCNQPGKLRCVVAQQQMLRLCVNRASTRFHSWFRMAGAAIFMEPF